MMGILIFKMPKIAVFLKHYGNDKMPKNNTLSNFVKRNKMRRKLSKSFHFSSY